MASETATADYYSMKSMSTLRSLPFSLLVCVLSLGCNKKERAEPGVSAQAPSSLENEKGKELAASRSVGVVASAAPAAEPPASSARSAEPTASAGASASAGAPVLAMTGVPDCDDFLKKFDKCVSEKAPASDRPFLYENRKQIVLEVATLLRSTQGHESAAEGCRQLLVRQARKNRYGCTW